MLLGFMVVLIETQLLGAYLQKPRKKIFGTKSIKETEFSKLSLICLKKLDMLTTVVK
jgi:hypothetical protein